MFNLVFIGGPGSGKGTHSDRLSQKFNLVHISTGDLYLKEIAAGTPLGLAAKKILDQGQLAPDEMTADLLRKRLAQPDVTQGFILDGFPRTLRQTDMLDEILRERGEKLDLVISLKIADEAIINRLAGRMICSKCHKSYHLVHNPPRKEGICDACGAALYHRSDDTPEVIGTRLRLFHEQADPIINHYRQKHILAEVDSDDEVNVVYARIDKVMDQHLSIHSAAQR